jgi:ribosome-binding factor A
MAKHRRQAHGPHDYPRTARLNELVREIVADELERLDDDRLELVTVVAVEVEPDLRHATVFFAAGLRDPNGEEGADDHAVLEALGEVRPRLQAAIGRQARVKRTPELAFRPDEVTRSASRIEEILRDLHEDDQP